MLGGENEGSILKKKSGDGKVYRRRSFKGLENNQSGNNLLSEQQQQLKGQAVVSGFDNLSTLSRDGLAPVKGVEFLTRQEDQVRIGLPVKSKRDALELRRKLEAERDMVRSFMSRIEAIEAQKNWAHKTNTGHAEKEKRASKANKLLKKSEFLLAKDKIRPAETNKKSKSKGGKTGNFPNRVFKSCNALLERLMKHKHGWVFNKPVDAVALGLHDYFEIIKNPMDLGTVKNRLTQMWYKSPVDFAEDVRLTFRNAMTYNPKGQDVYVIAEQMSKMFEAKWGSIEAQLKLDLGSPPPPRSRTETTMGDPKKSTMDIAKSGKASVSKKPKVKEPVKRDMTYDEKQKLSVDLQNLPCEKLENVVQIIKKRNSSVSQQDDEIEVDIDNVDTETLWELDRFVTKYKKSLSKNKRKAEIVSQSVTDTEQNTKEKVTQSVVTETPKESLADEERVVSPRVEVEEPRRDDTNQRAIQSSSSSDSGSSSNDSDVESSSADGSDGKRSPNN